MKEGPHSTDDINESVGGDLFDRYFTGEHTLTEAAPRTWFIMADYVGLSALETDEGLLLVDTGTAESAETVYELLRTRERGAAFSDVHEDRTAECTHQQCAVRNR